MSGGFWDYYNDLAAVNIYQMHPEYGEDGFAMSAKAHKRDPLDDPIISELAWDVFCLLHSYDWYQSDDTNEETYHADVARFKEKWLRDKLISDADAALEAVRFEDVKQIDIKYFNPYLEKLSKVNIGDWIDLRAGERVEMKKGDYRLIPLGVGMKLPDGYEAIVAPRSSTPSMFGIICANSIGVIDNSYCGNNDEWKFPAYAIRDTVIDEGDRIAQFRIIKNQPRIIFNTVEHLLAKSRGGIGSTGKR